MRARSCRSMALNVRNARTTIVPLNACSRTNSIRPATVVALKTSSACSTNCGGFGQREIGGGGAAPIKRKGHSGPFPFTWSSYCSGCPKPTGLRGLALGKRGKLRLLQFQPSGRGGRLPHRFKIADDRCLADPAKISCRRWPIPVRHVDAERGGKRVAVLPAAPVR